MYHRVEGLQNSELVRVGFCLPMFKMVYRKFPNKGAVRSDRAWERPYLESRAQELSNDIWQPIFCSIQACYIPFETSWTELEESKNRGCALFGSAPSLGNLWYLIEPDGLVNLVYYRSTNVGALLEICIPSLDKVCRFHPAVWQTS